MVVLLAAFAVAVLAGGAYFAATKFGGDDGANSGAAAETPIPAQTTADAAPTAVNEPAPTVTVTATATATVIRPVAPAGAFPGAGGPAPSGATPITAVQSRQNAYEPYEVAMIKTPSGNIGCDFVMDDDGEVLAGCGVLSYIETAQYGEDPVGPRWWIDLTGTGTPDIYSRGDAPYFEYLGPSPQVVDYGKAVTYGDFVCGSADDGLTCWNTVTGHGAFMNRRGFTAF
ncbi:MAG TPA: hypothetical protein PJ992_00520 [Arachnia sp.]|nr:hypothetical protein [Arachnia sp.]